MYSQEHSVKAFEHSETSSSSETLIHLFILNIQWVLSNVYS